MQRFKLCWQLLAALQFHQTVKKGGTSNGVHVKVSIQQQSAPKSKYVTVKEIEKTETNNSTVKDEMEYEMGNGWRILKRAVYQ